MPSPSDQFFCDACFFYPGRVGSGYSSSHSRIVFLVLPLCRVVSHVLLVCSQKAQWARRASFCGENKGEKKAQYAFERAVDHYEEAVAEEENYADDVAQREYEQAVAMGVPQATATILL